MMNIRLKILSFCSLLFASLLLISQSVSAQGQYLTGSTGIDVSWPNCNTSIPKVVFGIVGVTNGAGYSTSPCLAQEASHFPLNLSFYVNTGWYNQSSHINSTSPKVCTTGDNNCLAYNYGYNAGEYAYNAAIIANVHSLSWWLDVETINTWNSDVLQNQNSIEGEHDSLISHGATMVGIYSTTAQWQSITGGWQNNWPSWGATTWTSAPQAQSYCTGHRFTGGPSYLMQYKSKKSQLDQDVAC
jgi:hypothetical protein